MDKKNNGVWKWLLLVGVLVLIGAIVTMGFGGLVQARGSSPVPPTATPVPPTATPVPPTATPTPELTTPAVLLNLDGADCNLYGCTLPAGWEGVIPPSTTCSGDLVVNGTNYFDNVAETGAVGYSADGSFSVRAPWGAHCVADDQRAIKQIQVYAGGCANGCIGGVAVCNWESSSCYWYPDPK